jgi:acyl dehydratase
MRYLEDFRVGESYRLGEHVLGRAELVDFAVRFDPQPFHVDSDAAAESLFGGLVASGWHLCVIWMRLYAAEILADSASEGSPGVDRVRWLTPVRPGDRVIGRGVTAAVSPSLTRPSCGILGVDGELRNQHDETVLRLTLHNMFRRRPR